MGVKGNLNENLSRFAAKNIGEYDYTSLNRINAEEEWWFDQKSCLRNEFNSTKFVNGIGRLESNLNMKNCY